MQSALISVRRVWTLLAVGAITMAGCSSEGGSGDVPLDANVPGDNPLDAKVPSDLTVDGAVDPYWTGFDASVDRVPDAGAPVSYHWTDWTAAALGEDGGARGVVPLGLDASVDVVYTGQLYAAQLEDGGIDYWKPADAYQSDVVQNTPPDSDLLELSGGDGRRHVLTFSRPVVDPVLTILSMGSQTVTTACRFDDDFDLLSSGLGYYRTGEPLKHLPDHVLSGRESSGAIRFRGTYTTLGWTSLVSEPWYGLTVGVTQAR